MHIGEAHTFGRQLVQIGCRDLRGRIIDRQIAIAQIIGKDINNIGVYFFLTLSFERTEYSSLNTSFSGSVSNGPISSFVSPPLIDSRIN